MKLQLVLVVKAGTNTLQLRPKDPGLVPPSTMLKAPAGVALFMSNRGGRMSVI